MSYRLNRQIGLPVEISQRNFGEVSIFAVEVTAKKKTGESFSPPELAEVQTIGQSPRRKPQTDKEHTLQQIWARIFTLS